MTDRKLQVIPLGGLGEFGMNMTAIQYGDDMIVVDSGMMFPEDELLGVDLVMPDLTRGRMAVLISHRFSTVRMADRILVLADGAIQEQGTHQQLVALGGRYAELFELQAAGYR